MPELIESLQGRDLGFLRIVAELWGVEFEAPDIKVGIPLLTSLLLNPGNLAKMLPALPREAQKALNDLVQNQGRLSWALFTRRHGVVREMGPGRRDRERPFANAPSSTECLWYRALVSRGFFDTPTGPEEFAYIPSDLYLLLPARTADLVIPLGRPASQVEKSFLIPVSDRILDQACTLLAAIRIGLPDEEIRNLWEAPPTPLILMQLLQAAELLDANGALQTEAIKQFLESNRADSLAWLARAWLNSSTFNELHLLPGLCAEGEWQNDPLGTRREILDFLPPIPEPVVLDKKKGAKSPYWSLGGFISAVKQVEPDYQRTAGDYETWYLRDLVTNEYVTGFQNWDRVDGALMRFVITGPLHWLGILDLASPAEDVPPSAFAYSSWSGELLKGMAPIGLPEENGIIVARSDARLWVPRLAGRSVRYQVARFCDWEEEKEEGYLYKISPASLERARLSGLRVGGLLSILRRYATSVPPVLARALERWDERGVEAKIQGLVVLRLGSPEILQALRNSRAARFLGDPLGPTAVIIKDNAWNKVVAVLAELGYLSEVQLEEPVKGAPE